MNAEYKCCLSKCASVALIRWALGILFLVGGVAKLGMLNGFVTGYLVPTFSKTFLPVWMISGFGYTLPFIETILGIALILGIFRIPVLLLTGITLIALAFGQMLIQGFAVVGMIFLYVLMTAIALYLQEHDCWVIPCCCAKCGGSKSEEIPG